MTPEKTGPDASLLDSLREGDSLRLRAEDAEDLAVISSLLQDAVAPLGDLRPLPKDKRFAAVFNRYRWETPGERALCALVIEKVARVRLKGVDPKQPKRLLNLLAIRLAEPEGGAAAALDLTFSEDAAIRLDLDGLAMTLEDVGESYPTRFIPEHDGDA